MDNGPSALYKAVIYFGCATLYFYRSSISHGGVSVTEFRDKNPKVIKQVLDEAISELGYEMSIHQLNTAISAYIAAVNNPQTIPDKED